MNKFNLIASVIHHLVSATFRQVRSPCRFQKVTGDPEVRISDRQPPASRAQSRGQCAPRASAPRPGRDQACTWHGTCERSHPLKPAAKPRAGRATKHRNGHAHAGGIWNRLRAAGLQTPLGVLLLSFCSAAPPSPSLRGLARDAADLALLGTPCLCGECKEPLAEPLQSRGA
jgi:hypothetical protein